MSAAMGGFGAIAGMSAAMGGLRHCRNERRHGGFGVTVGMSAAMGASASPSE